MQLFDKKIITEKELSEVTGMSFDTGEVVKKWIGCNDIDKCQLFLQMYDKQLISKEVSKKMLLKILTETE